MVLQFVGSPTGESVFVVWGVYEERKKAGTYFPSMRSFKKASRAPRHTFDHSHF